MQSHNSCNIIYPRNTVYISVNTLHTRTTTTTTTTTTITTTTTTTTTVHDRSLAVLQSLTIPVTNPESLKTSSNRYTLLSGR
jgi:hypothetical protein